MSSAVAAGFAVASGVTVLLLFLPEAAEGILDVVADPLAQRGADLVERGAELLAGLRE